MKFIIFVLSFLADDYQITYEKWALDNLPTYSINYHDFDRTLVWFLHFDEAKGKGGTLTKERIFLQCK